MITVTHKMNTTADRFYDLLIGSVKHDIELKTGEPIELKDIKSGYEYKKTLTNKLGKERKATTTLLKIEPPRCYEAQFETVRGGVNTISYNIEDLDDGLIEVTYNESFDTTSSALALNFKIMSFFYKRSTRKRMSHLLKQMDLHLQATKDDV